MLVNIHKHTGMYHTLVHILHQVLIYEPHNARQVGKHMGYSTEKMSKHIGSSISIRVSG